MGLQQLNFEGKNKVEVAIDLLRACEPPDGYYGASSGGKDSEVIKHLSVIAKVKADWHYCVSPIDPPQIYQFLRQYHPDIQWDYHARGFWKLVVKNGLPTRKARWCCRYIKEAGGLGRVLITGNRRDEGNVRKGQKCFEKHRKVDKTFVRPIFYWTKEEVWEYIHEYNLPYCSLYDDGFERIGCTLCPFTRNYQQQLEHFPKVVRLWRMSADKIAEKRRLQGKEDFIDGQYLWDWWLKRLV